MTNIMSQFKLRNNPSRNAFDLSTRNAFTAKLGQLLPVLCEETLPGDKFKINLSHFSRTKPLTSPAYVRIKEYYDFIYVPTRLLWKYFDNFVTQMPNNVAASSVSTEVNTLSRHPYFTWNAIWSLLDDYNTNDIKDELGFNRDETSSKLLNYLGYPKFISGDNNAFANYALNPFPLLAYQKAYNDIYRWDAWESPSPHTFNVDWNSDGSEIALYPGDIDAPKVDYFSMRYANYPKDLIMGVLPNKQFGDVALVNTTANDITGLYRSTAASSTGIGATDTSGNIRSLGHYPSPTADDTANLKSVFNFSILALRQAEYLQKWKEVAQTAKQDYKNQIEAHFGVKVSAARSSTCEYLGGVSSNVQISGEVNTNLSDGSTVIKGTAMSAQRGQIDFDVPEHGYILCIYHASPLLDYNANYALHPMMLKTTPLNYAIPEFDKTGMETVPTAVVDMRSSSIQSAGDFIGYAPRYIDYKTDIDRCHGEFTSSGGYSNWVAPFDADDIQTQSYWYRYKFFKVQPSIFDGVFGVNANSSENTDQLLCNASFDVKAVRNLDTNGMPY